MRSAISEEKGSRLEIHFFDRIDSTQKRLYEDLKTGRVQAPIAYFSTLQTEGIGSRGNRWIGKEGNFYLSFAVERSALVSDLPLASASIYFSFLLKELLANKGSKVWLKWPNDFYIETKKVGGCITQYREGVLIVGIGLNLKEAPETFAVLDIEVDPRELVEAFLKQVECKISWKQIFSKYKIEFQKSQAFSVHGGKRRISLREARLAEDGAIVIKGERIYSLR